MSHVFISYSREEDQPYARKLADDLRKHDIEVWLDDNVDYGARWWKTIVKKVRTCAAFVVLMTPESEESEWVEREILLANYALRAVPIEAGDSTVIMRFRPMGQIAGLLLSAAGWSILTICVLAALWRERARARLR